jgi:hypothetical protein
MRKNTTEADAPTTIQARIRRARHAIGLLTRDGSVTSGPAKYDYVSHQRLLAAVDPALDAEGMWHSQSIRIDGSGLALVCTTTIHADDGTQLASDYAVGVPVPAATRDGKARNDLQSWGAAQSYARRLGLMAALGLRDGSDEQAEKYDRAANAATQPSHAEIADERAAVLMHYYGDDVQGGIRSLLPTLPPPPEGRLRAYLADGRDPLALPDAGWSALVHAMEAQASAGDSGIEGDLPL